MIDDTGLGVRTDIHIYTVFRQLLSKARCFVGWTTKALLDIYGYLLCDSEERRLDGSLLIWALI